VCVRVCVCVCMCVCAFACIGEVAEWLTVYIRFIRKNTSVDKPLLEYMNKKLNTR